MKIAWPFMIDRHFVWEFWEAWRPSELEMVLRIKRAMLNRLWEFEINLPSCILATTHRRTSRLWLLTFHLCKLSIMVHHHCQCRHIWRRHDHMTHFVLELCDPCDLVTSWSQNGAANHNKPVHHIWKKFLRPLVVELQAYTGRTDWWT